MDLPTIPAKKGMSQEESRLAALERHESECEFREVPCPDPDCDEDELEAGGILRHLVEEHHFRQDEVRNGHVLLVMCSKVFDSRWYYKEKLMPSSIPTKMQKLIPARWNASPFCWYLDRMWN